MRSDRSKRLLEENIPHLLFSFSMPAIVGMLAQALYNIIDRVFVGHAIGSNGIAGTTVSAPFMLVIMAFGMLVGFGSTALVSIRLGEKKHEEAERILGCAVVLLFCVGLVITVVGNLFLTPLLVLFGASHSILPFARDYMQIIILGSVFQIPGFGLNSLIRGEGNPRMAMVTMLISVFLNIVFAPIFIFVFHWGMRGAALATVLAQFVTFLWVFSYFVFGRSLVTLRLKNLRVSKPLLMKIIAMGSPPFALQLAGSLTNSLLMHQLNAQGGDVAISTMGIVFAVSMLVAMPIFGINQGAQPIIGFNYGAKQFHRVKKTLQTAILAASSLTCFGFIFAMIFPSQLVKLFNSQDAALLNMGTHAVRICMMMMPVVGFQIVSSSYFQAVGKPHKAMLLSLSRQVLLLLPAILVFPVFFGLDGVWAALPAADLASALWAALWLSIELRKLNEKGNVSEAAISDQQSAISDPQSAISNPLTAESLS